MIPVSSSLSAVDHEHAGIIEYKRSAGRKACEPCLVGGMNEHFSKHTAVRTPTRLRRLHIDLSGIQELSENRNKYFIRSLNSS